MKSPNAQYVEFEKALWKHVVKLPAEEILRGMGVGEQMSRITKDFQVLGIGEQSHGSSEFFKARTSLIRSLAADKSVDKIGLEAPANKGQCQLLFELRSSTKE